jgi:putative SOS response-associated peptidase YedK
VFLQNKERPFAFASVYDRWKNPETGQVISAFAIITTTAIEILQSIGLKRMQVLLTSTNGKVRIKSSRQLSELLGMLNQFPSEQMNVNPISELVNEPFKKLMSFPC